MAMMMMMHDDAGCNQDGIENGGGDAAENGADDAWEYDGGCCGCNDDDDDDDDNAHPGRDKEKERQTHTVPEDPHLTKPINYQHHHLLCPRTRTNNQRTS